MTGPRPNPLADVATESCAVDAPYTATVQELHRSSSRAVARYGPTTAGSAPAGACVMPQTLGVGIRAPVGRGRA